MHSKVFAVTVAAMFVIGGCQSSRTASTAPSAAPVVSAAASAGQASKAGLHYIDASSFDAATVLPGAPVDGGALTKGEAELMLAIQSEATEAARARSRAEGPINSWTFAEVLGPRFTRKNLPRVAELIRKADEDSTKLTDVVKKQNARTRPPMQDARIKPLLEVPASKSYPSGHAIAAMVWARVLSKVAPEREEELLQKARVVAYGRVVAGVHFPTDVSAGLAFGSALADEFEKSAEFRADVKRARAEWEGVNR